MNAQVIPPAGQMNEPAESTESQHKSLPAAGSRPRVSMLMPVYNGRRHLRTAVESVLNQTFNDFEYIIIDDGSTDDTWDILSEYATWDQRMRLVRNEQNMGVTGSLNKGLALARGDYIARQDADDISLPNRLAQQVQYMDTHPNVGLVGTWAQLIDEDGSIGETVTPSAMAGVTRWTLLFGNCFIHPSVMLRKTVLRQIGAYDPQRPHAEDYDLWSRMSFTIPLTNLPEVLVHKRLGESRVSSRHLHAQEETAIQVMHTAFVRLLGENISLDVVRNLRRVVCTTPLENAHSVVQTAWFIRRVYAHYIRSVPLSRAEKRIVAKDAANKLFILAGQNMHTAPLAALLAAFHAQQLDLRIPTYRTTVRLLQHARS